MKILNFPDVLSMLDSELSINNYEIFETYFLSYWCSI